MSFGTLALTGICDLAGPLLSAFGNGAVPVQQPVQRGYGWPSAKRQCTGHHRTRDRCNGDEQRVVAESAPGCGARSV
jgi:hypothetical protein